MPKLRQPPPDKVLTCIRIPRATNILIEEHIKKIGISKPAFLLNVIYKEVSTWQNEKQPAQGEQAEA